VSETFVDANGCRTWTAVDGQGPPVMLLHGGPGVCDYFEPVVPMLADRYTVHRYEQRGCGRTETVQPFDVATLVADVESLRRSWGIDRIRLVGHSWGAALAFMYASEHQDRVERAVLWCGIGIVDEHQAGQRAAIERRLTVAEVARMDELSDMRFAGVPDPNAAFDREAMRLLAISDLADRANIGLLPDPAFAYPVNWSMAHAASEDWRKLMAKGELDRRARALRVPVVVWQADGDPRPPESARKLAALIPGARFEILPGAGHLPWIERPDAVRARLRELLA
jgi:proline iminopeptidase